MLSYPLQSPLKPSSLQHSLSAHPLQLKLSGFPHVTNFPSHKNPQCRQLHLYPRGGGAEGSIMQPPKTLPATMHEQSASVRNIKGKIIYTKSSNSKKYAQNISLSINNNPIAT